MMVLVRLESLQIRALHSQSAHSVSLRGVVLEAAESVPNGLHANNVEICVCPANYRGDSCQVGGAPSGTCHCSSQHCCGSAWGERMTICITVELYLDRRRSLSPQTFILKGRTPPRSRLLIISGERLLSADEAAKRLGILTGAGQN